MIRPFVADLHVHSVLSPCAEVEMTPRNIVWNAVDQGIDIISITDHNACDNVAAALEAAKGTVVTILPGMEVETKEEVHLLVLFDKLSQLQTWEKQVQKHRSGRLNDEKYFGSQFVVDAEDNLLCVKPEMLLTSLSLGIAEVTVLVEEIGGICIASHVDRPTYSIISQLGFIPSDVHLEAVEVSRRTKPADAYRLMPAIGTLPVIASSDAHTMEDFIHGPKTVFYLEKPQLAELRQAFRGENLRKVVV
jgi:3',5'-nucleoside bisphosphate phosphatase